MTERRDLEIDRILDGLFRPGKSERGDWTGVEHAALQRSSFRSRMSRRRALDPRIGRRTLVTLGVSVAAIAFPLGVLASTSGWWFLDDEIQPVSPVAAVQAGDWNGHAWSLTAFRKDSGEICYGVNTPDASGAGSALNCDAISNDPAITTASKSGVPHRISYLAAGPTVQLESYVAGMVTSDATSVIVELSDGRSLTSETTPAPGDLHVSVRFFVVKAPGIGPESSSHSTRANVRQVRALDANQTIVACADLTDGFIEIPTSDCR